MNLVALFIPILIFISFYDVLIIFLVFTYLRISHDILCINFVSILINELAFEALKFVTLALNMILISLMLCILKLLANLLIWIHGKRRYLAACLRIVLYQIINPKQAILFFFTLVSCFIYLQHTVIFVLFYNIIFSLNVLLVSKNKLFYIFIWCLLQSK